MPLANSYDCDNVLGDHVVNPCQTNREFGRVQGSGFIDQDYLATLMANPTQRSLWVTGLTTGKITIIPETSGTYDPGDPTALKGYGARSKTNGPRAQKIVYNDPTYVDNYDYYNLIINVTDKVPFYKTSSLIHIADVPASIFAKDPVADDLKSEIDWQVTVDWESINLPSKHLATTIADLFTPAGLDAVLTGGVTPATFDTTLDFTSANSDVDAGVTGTVAANSATQKLAFNAIANANGTAQNMKLYIGTVVSGQEVISVDYPNNYNGQAFKYTHTNGTVYNSTFANGDKAL